MAEFNEMLDEAAVQESKSTARARAQNVVHMVSLLSFEELTHASTALCFGTVCILQCHYTTVPSVC